MPAKLDDWDLTCISNYENTIKQLAKQNDNYYQLINNNLECIERYKKLIREIKGRE